tara:strand:- start:1584 stop:2150 length:567 start_codon:yes stop_codon:yes gene_type:complete
MKKYITELTDILDVEFFQSIAKTLVTDKWLSLSDPEALRKFTDTMPVSVLNHPYLIEVKLKYPSLSNQIKFMKSTAGSWPVHTDSHRRCAINIPIANTKDTITSFYTGGTPVAHIDAEFGNTHNVWYSNEYLTYIINAKKDFDHVLQIPTIVNTTMPHGIVNSGTRPRIICSWAFTTSYEEACGELNV